MVGDELPRAVGAQVPHEGVSRGLAEIDHDQHVEDVGEVRVDVEPEQSAAGLEVLAE